MRGESNGFGKMNGDSKRKGVRNKVARKKGGAAVADAPPATLEELKKKLLARGKSQGSLTYEEINAAFDALEEVTP